MSESTSRPLSATDLLAMFVAISDANGPRAVDYQRADKWAQAATEAEELCLRPPVSGRQLANLARGYLELREQQQAAVTAERERVLSIIEHELGQPPNYSQKIRVADAIRRLRDGSI